jgi:SRSO17 transposase
MAEYETDAVDGVEAALTTVEEWLRPCFRRVEAHTHACAYLRGLLGSAERKNGWQVAEATGYTQPRSIQRVLDRSRWDAQAACDALRTYVIETLGAPDGVLVVDETGFLKQGVKSVGVKRQYSGTAGRIENCQIGVFLAYTSSKGRAGLDRALYLPQEWAEDAERRAAAGVPREVTFQTKPHLATALIGRALEGGVPAAWVTADEVYGNDSAFRRALEAQGQGYVVAVRRNQMVTMWPPYGSPCQTTVEQVAAVGEETAWERRSCGEGAQGERVYDWLYQPLRPGLVAGWTHALLVRRHPTRQEECAYYLVYAPEGTDLDAVVRAAGSRWAVEETFKLAKGQAGLDHYETRSWQGWHRHTALALWALAILAAEAAQAKGGKRSATVTVSPSASPNYAA